MRSAAASFTAGFTLIEVVVAAMLILVAFVGLYQLFQISARYVVTAKAREAALSLAQERMEQLRALSYSAVGTVGGTPSGSIPQSEIVALDTTTFLRATTIVYVDDPADGTGGSDVDAGGPNDYKKAQVSVSFPTENGTTTVTLVSNFISGTAM